MEYLKLILSPPLCSDYDCTNASTIAMHTLGQFLSRNTCSSNISFFKKWALIKGIGCDCGNITIFEKNNGDIGCINMCSEEKKPAEIKIAAQQFAQLLDDWEKIYKEKPQEIMVTHDDDIYTIQAIQ
jgi:hypothetical protein